jgi:hypothetical protein
MLVMFSSLVLQGTIAVRVPLVFGASSNLEHRLSHLPRLRLAPRQVVDSAGDDVVAYNTPPADDPVQTAIAFNKMWDSAGMVGWKITGPGHGFTLVRLDDWQGAVASSPLSHLGFHAPIVFTTSSTQLQPPAPVTSDTGQRLWIRRARTGIHPLRASPQGLLDQRPTEAPIGPSHQNSCVCDLHFIFLGEIRGKAASRPGSPCSS